MLKNNNANEDLNGHFPSLKLSQFYMPDNERSIPTHLKALANDIRQVGNREQSKAISSQQALEAIYNIEYNHYYKHRDFYAKD